MDMNYELATELREAGFPQGGKGTWTFPHENLVTRRADRVYAPTLEELIEACGQDFKCLRNFRREMWAVHGRIEGDKQFEETWPYHPDYVAEAVRTYTADEGSTGPISASGFTPSEAVGRLWLALNQPV